MIGHEPVGGMISGAAFGSEVSRTTSAGNDIQGRPLAFLKMRRHRQIGELKEFPLVHIDRARIEPVSFAASGTNRIDFSAVDRAPVGLHRW